MTGWLTTTDRVTVWPVDDYSRETPRTQQWLGTDVTKHHRRLTTSLIGGILTAGLLLTVKGPFSARVPVGHRGRRRA